MSDAAYRSSTQDARTVLTSMGMGNYDATMVIPYLFLSPAGTDPDMPQIRLLVGYVQRNLRMLGANVAVTEVMGEQDGVELSKLTGPNWPGMMWMDICQALLRARSMGTTLRPVRKRPTPELETVGGLPAIPSLPGPVVAGAAIVAAWYLFIRKR